MIQRSGGSPAPTHGFRIGTTHGAANESGIRIAVGPDGYVYVAGSTDSFGAGWYDLFLLKLDTHGNLRRAKTWGGSSYDVGYDIGFDQAGNVYVAGESYSNGASAVLLKFAPADGSLIWSTYSNGPSTYDAAYSMAVDSNYNVILAGTNWDYSVYPNHNSILVVKYDASGNYLWSENRITTSPGQDEAGGHSVTTDGFGNIYIGGRHSESCTVPDFRQCDFSAMVLKLGPDGSFQWAKTWGKPGYDSVGSVAFNSREQLLAPAIEDAYGTPQLALLSYDTGGNLLASVSWGGTETVATGVIPTIALDDLGTAWIVGSAQNNGGAWSPTSAVAGTLPNSLMSYSYSTGTPTGSIGDLAIPMQSQTGMQDTGGGGSDVSTAVFPFYLASGPFLDFPLQNRTAYTASINSLFDHSAQFGYCPDGSVTAYTGETGTNQFPSRPVGLFTCITSLGTRTALYAYQQAGGQPFIVNGHYTGSGYPNDLYYDGYSGIDYKTTDQNGNGEIPVLAAASGTILCVNIAQTDAPPCMEGPGDHPGTCRRQYNECGRPDRHFRVHGLRRWAAFAL